jgi:hypothetical protein
MMRMRADETPPRLVELGASRPEGAQPPTVRRPKTSWSSSPPTASALQRLA